MRLRAPLLAVLVLMPALAHAGTDSPYFDPETMMRTSELRRGMTGYGLSVFAGVEPERFDVEVLGVLSKANLGEDLILIEVTSGPIVERKSGIIGGMSGSPVYVDGRLIGAIAYGWSFLREAVGGVTPIAAMLDSYDGGGEAALPDDHPLRGARLAGRWVDRARVDVGGPAFHDEHTINIRPVGPLVSVAGMGDAGMSRLDELLGPHGMETMPGPGRLAEPVPTELRPGSAVGVKLIEGDFDATMVGTVTWRNGDSLLALGHPMMEMGAVQIPISTAWVHDFLPSVARSFKLTSPMELVGTLTRDGTWSVGARVGPEAPMVPGSFRITDEDRGLTRQFRVRVAQHELLTPGLLMSSLLSALEAAYDASGEGLATLDFELKGDEGAVIRRHDVVWHPGMMYAVAGWVDEAMYFLTENRFEPQQVAGLQARVSLRDEAKLAAIERIYTDEHVARAAEQLTVHVVMRPESGERFEKVVTFDLPQDLRKGQLRVAAASGADEFNVKAMLRLLLPQIDSLEDIASVIEEMKRADQLYVAISVPRVSLGLEGTELPALPPQAVNVLAEDQSSDITSGYAEISETFDTGYFVYGIGVTRLPTENRLGERGKVSKKRSEDTEGYEPESYTGRLQHMWWAASALQSDARPLQDGDLPTQTIAPPDLEMMEDVGEEPGEEEEADEEGEEEDRGEHPEPDGEALTRGLSRFVHETAKDFEEGETDGTMVRSDGAVLLAPRATLLGAIEEPGVWSIAADGEAAWFGTYNPGRVYRWRPGSEPEMVADTGSMMVLSLLATGDGAVLAGTGPDGRVLRIAADGRVEVAHKLEARYVWALERMPDGSVMAGTGPQGRIFRLGEEPELVSQISKPHVLDLVTAGDRLYAAGGDDRGGVFEILATGYAREVFGSDDEVCTSLALDGKGRLIIGTAEQGKVIFVDPDGRAREVLEAKEDVLGMAFADGLAYAATADEGRVVAIDGEGRTAVALEDEVAGQITCIAAGAGAVYAATANPARLWRLDLALATEGSFTSRALDAERMARWARMSWDATIPEGATLQVGARSGNSPTPDDGSWSAWTAVLLKPGERMAAPAARYLQYRLRLAGPYSLGPNVRRTEVLYLPRNRRPTLEVSKPDAGQAIRGEFEISWDAEDDDDDTLVTTIFARAEGEDDWRQLEVVEDEDSWKWDTSEVEDGRYTLKIVVSDEPSNPADAEREEAVVEGVVVDNRYPVLKVLSRPRRGDDEPTLSGLAIDEMSRLTSIDWSFGDEERWRAAPIEDGLLDSRRELFTIRLPEIPDEQLEIQIRLRDAAGNVTVETLPLLDQQPEGETDTGPMQAEAEG